MNRNFNDQAAGKLDREMTGWSTIEIQVREMISTLRRRPGELPAVENHSRYIETNRSQRFLDLTSGAPGRSRSRIAGYSDGTRCAKVFFRGDKRQSSCTIGRSFMNEGAFGSTDRPSPLRYFYVGKVPIHKALAKASYLGKGVVAGRESQVFLFPRVKWANAVQDLVYDLDRLTSIPIRVRAYLDLNDKIDPNTAQPAWTWFARSVDTIAGYSIPMQSEFIAYVVDERGAHPEKRQTIEIHVELVRHNVDYPKSTFWPVLQLGVQIHGETAKKHDTLRTPKGANRPHDGKATAVPIAAASDGGDGTPGMRGASVLFGMTVLFVGLFKWRRAGSPDALRRSSDLRARILRPRVTG